MSTYLIIGASRGIGLSLVSVLGADPGNTVIATVRKGSDLSGINALGYKNLKLVYLDMAEPYEAFEKAFADLESLTPNGVDVVIHNAGINYSGAMKPLQYQTFDKFSSLFDVNATAVVKVYKAIFNRLEKSGRTLKYVVISSSTASIAEQALGFGAYGASKAASNYFTKQISQERKALGDIVVPLHPGLVLTDMGKSSAADSGVPPEVAATFKVITPDESAKAIVEVINKLTIEDTGKFLDYEGNVFPY